MILSSTETKIYETSNAIFNTNSFNGLVTGADPSPGLPIDPATITIVTRETEDTTREVIRYGQGLVNVLRGFKALEAKASWFERLLIKLLRTTYQRRLREIIGVVPAEIGDQILGTMDTHRTDK